MAFVLSWGQRRPYSDDPQTADLVAAFEVARSVVEGNVLSCDSLELTSYRTHVGGLPMWSFDGRCQSVAQRDLFSITVLRDETGAWYCRHLRIDDEEIVSARTSLPVVPPSILPQEGPSRFGPWRLSATTCFVFGLGCLASAAAAWSTARYCAELRSNVPLSKLRAAREAVDEGHLERARAYLARIIEQHPQTLFSREAERMMRWI